MIDLPDFPPELRPRGVTCMRGSFRRGNQTYDAELAFNGTHYVIKTGIKDRDEAQQIANTVAKNCEAELIAAGNKYVAEHKWPKAKE